MKKYTEEELRNADLEIQALIDTGKYKQLEFEVIESVKDIELTDKSIDMFKKVLETYFNYLELLDSVKDETKEKFLNTLKFADVADNQKLEMENSFIISMYMQSQKKFAIDEILYDKHLNKHTVLTTHKLLMKNTSTDNENTSKYRNSNRKYVGGIVNGVRNIQYFPLDYNKIDKAMDEILKIYNDKNNEYLNTIFFKPFIIHGLVAAYQMFDDGNTRLARLMQHVKLFNMTNEYTGFDLKKPAIYATRAYYPYRAEYRDLIKNIVLSPNTENWNNWFIFNLKRLEDQMFCNINNLEEIKKSEIFHK